LKKLEQWFVDPVAQDLVSVKSFDGQWEVSTFRTIGNSMNYSNRLFNGDRL